MAVYRERDVIDTPQRQSTAVSRRVTVSPGQILSGIAGLVLVVFGIVAVTRNGIDSTLNVPVTDVFGLTQSAAVGLIEVGTGLLLILAATNAAFRALTGVVGVLLFIGGLIVAAGDASLLRDLGTTHDTGWFGLVMGGVAMLAAALPTFTRHDRVTRVE
jgi:hypothetical protein